MRFVKVHVNHVEGKRQTANVKFKTGIFELFWKNSSYVSGVSACIFVALYVGMFVARANKGEGTMSWCLGTNEILASI